MILVCHSVQSPRGFSLANSNLYMKYVNRGLCYVHTVVVFNFVVLESRSHIAFSQNICPVVLWCVVFFPVKWGLSRSRNSIKCLLFVLKFSFHFPTLVLLFKMFLHQKLVVPGRHRSRCFFGGRLY